MDPISPLNNALESPLQRGRDWRWIEAAAWSFVCLGVLLRIYRFELDFPFWGDEAFLAVNLFTRSYRELLKPLSYGQICPVLFLWVERWVVQHVGSSEAALRSFPFLCGVGGLFLFKRLAGLVAKGWGQAFAVAFLAVSFHPIRHGAEVKPYASDLFVSILTTWLAAEWLMDRSKVRYLAALALIVPLALAISHPAVFVAGAAALALAKPVWDSKSHPAFLTYALFLVLLTAAFLTLFVFVLNPQNQVHLAGLRRYWTESFPPLKSPVQLIKWLVSMHTGSMMAYPGGAKDGASSTTLALLILGATVLVRRGRGDMVALCLWPFGLALAAAALKRYPYGGETRQMQFVAPAICLLAGAGAASALAAVPRTIGFFKSTAFPLRSSVLAFVALALVVIGVVPLALDSMHPYRRLFDRQVRDFAKTFWPEVEKGAEVLCLEADGGVVNRRGHPLKRALFVSNAFVQSPAQRAAGGPVSNECRWITRFVASCTRKQEPT